MPCTTAAHSHNWPTSGNLVIHGCETYCAFCTGHAVTKNWRYVWFLARHVRTIHKRDFPNITMVTTTKKLTRRLKPRTKAIKRERSEMSGTDEDEASRPGKFKRVSKWLDDVARGMATGAGDDDDLGNAMMLDIDTRGVAYGNCVGNAIGAGMGNGIGKGKGKAIGLGISKNIDNRLRKILMGAGPGDDMETGMGGRIGNRVENDMGNGMEFSMGHDLNPAFGHYSYGLGLNDNFHLGQSAIGNGIGGNLVNNGIAMAPVHQTYNGDFLDGYHGCNDVKGQSSFANMGDTLGFESMSIGDVGANPLPSNEPAGYNLEDFLDLSNANNVFLMAVQPIHQQCASELLTMLQTSADIAKARMTPAEILFVVRKFAELLNLQIPI